MPRHNDPQHAELVTPAPAHPSPSASRELLDAMEQVVSQLAAFCREVEALLNQSRRARLEHRAS